MLSYQGNFVSLFDSMHVLIRDLPPTSSSYVLHVKALIDRGKGVSPRDTESGQLLIDRALHLDVLEYLLWINR